MSVQLLLWKEVGGNWDGDNIIKSMRSGRNSKTTNSKKSRKVNACDRPKNKLGQVERIDGIWLPAEKINMVVCAKQRRRNEDRKHNGIRVIQFKRILEQQH